MKSKTVTMRLQQEFKRRYRKVGLAAADTFCFLGSYWFSWFILMRRVEYGDYLFVMELGCLWFLALFLLSFTVFKMYDSLWRYAGFAEYLDCIYATVIAGGAFYAVSHFWLQPPRTALQIPLTVNCLAPMMAGMSALSLRMFYRAWKAQKLGTRLVTGAKKTIIVGAGNAGLTVARELSANSRQHEVVCFADDAPHLRGSRVMRIPVEGTTNDVPRLALKHGADVIIIAIPTATREEMHRIATVCDSTKCIVKKVPTSVLDMVTADAPLVKQIKDISVEDLLGRSVIDVNINKSRFLSGKTVLVTGAGGSIGSELCRQAVINGAERLVMFDISENGLYDIQQELIRKYKDKLQLYTEVASIRDEDKIDIIFGRYKPDIVYHAAAHKHVPLMEFAPEEAVKNNIFGTLKLCRCVAKHGAKRFVMVSTDKAVNPTSIMGATKRVCEMIIQTMNEVYSDTDYVAVRFGNVLGSNGSVIPLFKQQIKEGGPVTVTDERITRYFMTIPEAVGLVMTAGEMAKGGEIFVLDMGEPVKIIDLAKTLIKMSGYEPYKDIDIVVTGLRSGEKLYEELLIDREGFKKTSNDRIFIDNPINISYNLLEYLGVLRRAIDSHDVDEIMKYLCNLVPELPPPPPERKMRRHD